jgi:pimeloyl-ACP methyl ester carboxylesterase
MVSLALLTSLALGQPSSVAAKFVQVAPAPQTTAPFVRSKEQDRAVVLIHGYSPQPSHRAKATFHSYQHPGSPLVKSLARLSDIFAFAYAQTVPVDDIAGSAILHQGLVSLRQLGYAEIVLVGFSAGGLVAREFVEDTPTAGVTKVIQVCAPNTGTTWSAVTVSAFAHSLSPRARARHLQERQQKRIPEGVQFVCMVGNGLVEGDGVVSTWSQWPEDLQRQGIPVHLIHADHLRAARSRAGVEMITQLVEDNQPRWSAFDVAIARKRLEIWK